MVKTENTVSLYTQSEIRKGLVNIGNNYQTIIKQLVINIK